jgi:hypothetical protein
LSADLSALVEEPTELERQRAETVRWLGWNTTAESQFLDDIEERMNARTSSPKPIETLLLVLELLLVPAITAEGTAGSR